MRSPRRVGVRRSSLSLLEDSDEGEGDPFDLSLHCRSLNGGNGTPRCQILRYSDSDSSGKIFPYLFRLSTAVFIYHPSVSMLALSIEV